MTEAGQQKAVTAAFPPPPPFWRHFSAANVQKLEEIKEEAARQRGWKVKRHWSPSELRALEVSPELRFLVPPETPKSGHYSVFGETQSLSTALPSLREQGIEQLYPSPSATDACNEQAPLNHAFYLLKISKSLLLNFLEFVGILSVAPEQFEPKLEDLRNLFINAHHLLNLYRPHQARESLILIMEEQLDRAREEIREMDRVKEHVDLLLQRLRKDDLNTTESSQREVKEGADNSVEEVRQIWTLLNKDIGC